MFYRRILAYAITGLFLLTLTLSGCGKNEVTLEYRMPKNEEAKYKIKNSESATSTNSLNAGTNQAKQIMEAEITQKVKDVEKDGTMIMDITYNNLKFTVERDGKSQEIPTAAMEGKTYSMKMDKRGKISEMESSSGSASTGSMNQMSQANAIFPEKPVKVGETWDIKDSKNEIPLPGTDVKILQNIETSYTFEKIEKIDNIECARLQMKSIITQKNDKKKIKKPDDGSGKPPEEVSIDDKGEGRASGTIFFALKKGKIVKLDTEMTMNNSMTIQQGSRKQTSTTKIQRSMSMELIK